MVASLCSAGVGFVIGGTVLGDASHILRLVLLTGAFTLSYLLLAVGVFRMRTPVMILLSLVRDHAVAASRNADQLSDDRGSCEGFIKAALVSGCQVPVLGKKLARTDRARCKSVIS
jgi:hypothetical protein